MLLGIYLFTLCLGGVLIAASLFMGSGGDADAAGELGVDADADLDAPGDLELAGDAELAEMEMGSDLQSLSHHLEDHPATTGWLPFLSLRFWTFALASFGLTGTLLHVLGVAPLLSLLVAGPTGVAIGTSVSTLFRWLWRSGNASTSPRSLQGADGVLLLPLAPGRTGKVRLVVGGQHVDLMARSREPEPIPALTPVLVVTVEDGVAEVVPLPRNALKKH